MPWQYVSDKSPQDFLAMRIRHPFSRAKASLITGDFEEPLIGDFFPRTVRRLRRRISDDLGATQPSQPALPPPMCPSESAALIRPLTSPVSKTSAGSAQPIVEPLEELAPGARAAPSVATPATTGVVAAKVAAAAPSPSQPPSPPATTGGALSAAKKRALTKPPRAKLVNTPQMLMSAPRGGAKSPAAEGDAGAESEAEKAESDGEDEPYEGEEEEEEEQEKEDKDD